MDMVDSDQFDVNRLFIVKDHALHPLIEYHPLIKTPEDIGDCVAISKFINTFSNLFINLLCIYF